MLASEISSWLLEALGTITNRVRWAFETFALQKAAIISWCLETSAAVVPSPPKSLCCLPIADNALSSGPARLLETPLVSLPNLLSPVGLETA